MPGQHAGVSWVPPDSHLLFSPLPPLAEDLKSLRGQDLLGLEPLIKLHHAFSTLHFKSLVISGENFDVHSFFKPLEHSLISFAVEKADLRAFFRQQALD